MTIERPTGLVLNDIVIKRNEAPSDAADKKLIESEALAMAPGKPKTNLLAGLISDDAQGGNTDNYEIISVNMLDPFYDHFFKPYSEEEMSELVESVKMIGIKEPLVVRRKDNGRCEILAGHNRWNAAKRAGLRTVPCKVENVDDEIAKLIVLDTNLKQRQSLSYSEKAKAYKMQIEIFKKQGKRTDLTEAIDQENNFGQILPKVEKGKYARDIVADMYKTKPRQISNYIRLTYLTQDLLNKVDSEVIPFTAGVELSHLPIKTQERVNEVLDILFADQKTAMGVEAAETLHSMSAEDLSSEDILNILSRKPRAGNTEEPKSKKLTPFKTAFKAAEKQFKKIDHYTVESIDEKELEKIVVDAVEEYLIRKRN